MDTGEIWYEMQGKVSHLPRDERNAILLDAAFNLVARAEQERDNYCPCDLCAED